MIMTVLRVKSVWKWEIDIIFQMLIGKSITHFNEINKCSFDFLNQFNYQSCVCLCVSVRLCLCLILQIDTWAAKTNIGIFFSEIFVGTMTHHTTENKGRYSVSNHQHHDCLLNRLFRRRTKETSKLRVTGLCAGNSPVTGEFPAQMASNEENVSIWWRHHEVVNTKIYLNTTDIII